VTTNGTGNGSGYLNEVSPLNSQLPTPNAQ
jgi:hypothetical protein